MAGDINLAGNTVSGILCQVDRVRNDSERLIIMTVEHHLVYHSHYAVMWGWPRNIMKIIVRGQSSTDPRRKVGALGRATRSPACVSCPLLSDDRSRERRMSNMTRRLVSVAAVLTGLLSCVAVAFAAQSSQYGGTTSQRVGGSPLRITLAVAHGAVSNVQLTALTSKGGTLCALSGDGTLFTFAKGKATIGGHHTFNGKLTDGLGDSITISGRVTPTSITGSFVVVDSTGGAQGTHVCDSGTVRYHVRASGDEVRRATYSGSIGPGYPITFRVSADGKAVDGLVLDDDVTCGAGAGNSAPAFSFGTLQIKSGSFTGASSDHFGPGDSVSVRITGTFFGRVATGQVAATQQIRSLGSCTQTEPFTANAN